MKNSWEVGELKLDVDAVLRGQGADPVVLRQRRPKLVLVAEQALAASGDLLKPEVFWHEFRVGTLRHTKLELEGSAVLRGEWITSQLAPAEKVHVILCTVGAEIEKAASQAMQTDMLLGLAMDGVGSAGVEALAQMVCQQIENRALANGQQTTVPYSPGMINWAVEEGQPQIFDLLSASITGVELTASMIMLPRKSLTMLIGVGSNLQARGTPCDYCAMQGTCKYRSFGGHTLQA